MEAITFDNIKTAIIVLLAIAGALRIVDGAIDAIKKWRKPRTDVEENTKLELDSILKKMDTGKQRLDCHDEQIQDIQDMCRASCMALKALLSHGINGNSIDKLKLAEEKLDSYLIEAGTK